MLTIPDIINLDRYPIIDLATTAAQSTLSVCHEQIAQNGLCLLPDFIRPDALNIILDEARSLTPAAHRTEHWRTTANGADNNQTGTLARATRACMGSIAYDDISAESPLRTLYEWDGFTAFINAVLNRNNRIFYRTNDTLVNCMLTVLTQGDELGWHYDPNDGVVSLLLQAPDQGGEFEFAPDIRAPAPNAAKYELEVLDNEYEALISHAIQPGTLSLFNGHRSLHRVAPVTGQRERVIALFNYAEQPGYCFSADIHQRFFGRTIPSGNAMDIPNRASTRV